MHQPAPGVRVRKTPALTLSALAIAALIGSSMPAIAGPDDGKIVGTQAHIDAPQTVWENNSFSLYGKMPHGDKNDALVPFDKSVLWIGKGYSAREAATNQYIFTVPDSPNARFLGEPGQQLYMAPSLPYGNHNPAWIGFGADTDIPIENFRDGTFTLDLLNVKGPGVMEMFTYRSNYFPNDVRRMLSSTDPDFQSAVLTPGAHTHNFTTFSRPGRYEVTYRTVARGLDGQTIESKPTTAIWQVGGNRPVDGAGVATEAPLIDTYNKALTTPLTRENYSLTLAPKAVQEKDGDQHLTDITFDAGRTDVSGTLTLYNQGYFLTDVRVEEGKATWSEMLGSLDSQIQAVFLPDGAAAAPGAQAAKWVTPALTYKSGGIVSVRSAAGEGTWPAPVNDPRNTVLPTGHHQLTSGDYTVSVAPSDKEGYNLLQVKFTDPTVRAYIHAGMYRNADSASGSANCYTFVDNGTASCYISAASWLKNHHLILAITPHPDMDARTARHTVTSEYQPGQSYTTSDALTLTEPVQQPTPSPEPTVEPSPEPSSTPSPEPSPEPSPAPSIEPTPAPTPALPAQQCQAPDLAGRYLLTDGHVDIKATLAGGALALALKDETRQITTEATDRSLNEVAFGVTEAARFTRTPQLMAPELDFLGPAGSEFYGLPQTQQPGIIWPGWNTQDVDYSQITGPVTLHMVPKTLPQGASYGIYEQDFAGKVTLHAAGGAALEQAKTAISIDFATHAHANWVFTTPGTYAFDVYYSAPLPDGTTARSETQQTVFAVGQQAIDDCLTAGAEPSPEPSAEPTAEPSAEPSVEPSADPSATPTAQPSGQPSPVPSADPSRLPVFAPQPAPAPSVTTEPSATPTATAGASESATPGAGAGAQVNGSAGAGAQQGAQAGTQPAGSQPAAGGGVLASTGAQVLGLAATGLAALAGGLALLRRRQR
ncbi:choice-of-anchor M domain-containing protein [Rothia nasimurium]|uniref:choice-of-anchor M domain-containing protein n=1 Tax=Rothia nasimurium TaxID=85336 RepID=UPI001F3FBCA0|nr:choice-of-anchor M domain-containing protein [Rothia nasimurium]